MDNKKLDELIDWCRQKIANIKKECRRGCLSFNYMSGYEDAMKVVMSKLHGEKRESVTTNTQVELIKTLQEELDAAKKCIYKVEDALNRGSDNDYARQAIEEWAEE